MKNQRWLGSSALAIALLVGAACGSISRSSPDGGVAPDEFALSVNPGAVSIGIAGDITVSVEVLRGAAFTDAVALSVAGMPGGVTAELEAASVPGGTGATNLVITVDRAADAGVSTVTVTGVAGEMTRSTTLELTLTTAEIRGTVRDKGADAVVRIVGKPATTTDVDGNFTFTDVKVPYDIYVVGQAGPQSQPYESVTYYTGLTTTAPVLTRTSTYCAGVCSPVPNRSAYVIGSRQGSGTNAGPTYLAFTNAAGSQVNTDGSWGPTDLTARWFSMGAGDETRQVRLNGLQATRGPLDSPTGWFYAQSAEVTVSTEFTATINLSLAPLNTTASLTGIISQPATYSAPKITLSQSLGDSVVEVWTPTAGVATSTIPVLPEESASFYVESTTEQQARIEAVYPGLTSDTDVSMTLPPAAVLTSPADSATNVSTATPFEFTTTPNHVYEVYLETFGMVFVIYTTTGSVTIPDVPELQLPANKGFFWLVRGYAPHASIDEAVSEVGLRKVSRYEAEGTMHMMSTSLTRNFTSQP